MTPHPMSAVAVVNADGVNVAIWHVAAEPVARTARLCGAWVTDDPEVQTRVIAARAVVVFGDDPTDRIRPLLTHAGGIIDIPATLLAIGQHISAVDEVHRDPQLTVVLAPVVHAHDVGVPQGGRGFGFPAEPGAVVGVVGQSAREDLQRVAAVQSRMADEVDLAHPAGTQLAQDGEVGEGLTAGQRHGRIVPVAGSDFVTTARLAQRLA